MQNCFSFFLPLLAPTVEVVRSQIIVEENVGKMRVPLRRTGDSSQQLHVTCLTTSDMGEGMKVDFQFCSLTELHPLPIVVQIKIN